jgi:hypothetical protein
LNLDQFEDAARIAFAFLEEDFAFAFTRDSEEDRKRHWWVRYLTYRNNTTFVRVELDDRERVFNVLFGPLDDGQIPEYPIFLPRQARSLTWFPLWAVIEMRNEEAPPFSFAKGERLGYELGAWAEALRRHAEPALRGSFADLDREGVYRVMSSKLEAAEREIHDRRERLL